MRIDRLATLTGLAGMAVATLLLVSPASALTMAECSTKYNAAKDAGGVDPVSPDSRRLGLSTEADELAGRFELQS